MIRHHVSLLLFLAGAGLAHGQWLSYQVAIPGTPTNWTQPVEIPAFESSLGTLTNVLLVFTGNVAQSVRVENLGANDGAEYTLTSAPQFTLGRAPGDVPLLVSDPISEKSTGSLAPFDGQLDYSGPSGSSFTRVIGVSESFNDPNLGAYVASSPLLFYVTAALTENLWSVLGSGSQASITESRADAILAVRYSYTPIPEPADAVAWMGMAVVGALLFRRGLRRRRQSRVIAV